jgi:hypothetical protein
VTTTCLVVFKYLFRYSFYKKGVDAGSSIPISDVFKASSSSSSSFVVVTSYLPDLRPISILLPQQTCLKTAGQPAKRLLSNLRAEADKCAQ